MPSEPRISVVIPAFNRERTIGRAIESVLSQTLRPAEIVVVDDGSTDGTAGAVAAFGDAIRLVPQANAGASAARNRGVELAGSPWVAFLDSDDHWLPDHLERMAAAIAATDGAAGFYFADTLPPATATEMWGAKDCTSLWDASDFSIPSAHLLTADATDWVMLAPQPLMLQSTVFSREHYLAAGGLTTELRTRHDTHLYFLMGIGRPACAVAGAGVQMTDDDQSGGRLTASFGPESRDWLLQSEWLYADVLRRFPELDREHRRELTARLATTELQLSRASRRSREIGAACAHLARALRLAPLHIAGRAARKAGRALPV